MIGTAPRNPIQPMYPISRGEKRSGVKHTTTAIGRATNAKNNAIARPIPATPNSCEGNTNKPSIKNSAIWLSQANDSCTRISPLRYGSGELPSTNAVK